MKHQSKCWSLNSELKCTLILQSLFRWSRPSQVNGALEFYSIYLSHDGAEPILAYNSSELFEDHTLRNLTPGTAYTVTLAVSSSLLSSFHWRCHIYLHINVLVCVCSCKGLHRRWVHVKPSQPGSDWGEHTRGCPSATGHPFVPTCCQRQLATSWFFQVPNVCRRVCRYSNKHSHKYIT